MTVCTIDKAELLANTPVGVLPPAEPAATTPERPAEPLNVIPEQRLTLTVPEAARSLSISPKTLKRRINDGTIPAYRFGTNSRSMLVKVADLEAALVQVPSAGMWSHD